MITVSGLVIVCQQERCPETSTFHYGLLSSSSSSKFFTGQKHLRVSLDLPMYMFCATFFLAFIT